MNFKPGLIIGVILSGLLAASAAQAQQVDHPAGFTGQTDLTLTNNASVTAGGLLQITPNTGNNKGSAFTTAKVPINQFTTQFDFHLLGAADGMGFCIQNVANTTIGNGGGGMGFNGMAAPSMFIKFDNYNNVSTTQIYTNGTDPGDPGSIDLRAVGIDWHTNHDFRCNMSYNGTAITMLLTDLTTNATNTQTFTIDLVTLMGGGTAFVGFVGATGGASAAHEVLNWTYSSLPAPTGVTSVPGFNSIVLNWNAVAGATGYKIWRTPPAGTPPNLYTLIATVGAVTTYTDNTVQYPTSYTYVIQALQGAISSLYSAPHTVTPLQPPITVSATALTTDENLTNATFNIVLNQALAAGTTINFTVTSSDGTEGQVSGSAQPMATSISFPVNGPQGAGTIIPITVHGQDDPQVDPTTVPNYTVTVTFTQTGPGPFTGFTIPPIQCTNNDNDTPGVTVSPTAGLLTSESGGIVQFTVRLTTQPTANVDITLVSTNPLEGTLSTGGLTFTSVNWMTPQTVTITGVDDPLLDFAVAYSITTSASSGDPGYNGIAVADVSVTNLDNEVPPELPVVWGNSGCGLLGLEALLILGLRRRRKIFAP